MRGVRRDGGGAWEGMRLWNIFGGSFLSWQCFLSVDRLAFLSFSRYHNECKKRWTVCPDNMLACFQ